MTTSLVTIPFIGQAYRYSSHEPGTLKDADFWFLLQSSCMQLLNLATTLISMYKDTNIHKATRQWMFATTVLGMLTTVSAMAIYVRLPTEWSSMLACIAPIL